MENRIFLQKGPVVVRPLREEDAPLLWKWLTDSLVLEWYEGRDQVFTPDRVRQEFYTDEPGQRRCVVEYEGRPVGYVQMYPLGEEGFREYGYFPPDRDNPGFQAWGIDQFIGDPACWSRGIGRTFVGLILDHLTRRENAAAVVLDPHCDNPRAIRCYAACGFQKRKLLPAHELHEGEWKDCWLMEYRPGPKG